MAGIEPSEAREREREREINWRAQDEQERDRVADMTPAPRSPRTPREQVEAAVLSARVQLDQALAVVRGTAIVDGAAVLRAKIGDAQMAAREAGADEAAEVLDEVLELLTARVRSVGLRAPVPVATGAHLRKRAAVHAVIMRRQEELESGGLGLISEDVLDELIAAAETGI
jgi:hypothetical protein